MSWTHRGLLICLVCVCGLGRSFAATYYVSPDGNDQHAGDRQHPWKTLDKVNKAARAGDTVTFLPGEYPGTLAPDSDGEEGAPITFRSERPLKARLRGGHPVIKLEKKSYIILEGFHVEPRHGRFLTAEDCSHLTIRGCTFENANRGWAALSMKGCRDVRFLDNTCHKNRQLRSDVAFTGHAFEASQCRRMIFEGNLIGKGGHGGLQISSTDGLVVRRNIFNGAWGRALSVYRYTKRVLFEENVITGGFDSGGSAGPGSAFQTSDGILRRNLVVRNWGTPLGSALWKKGNRPVSEIVGNRWYHNTLCFNLEGAWGAVLFNPEYADVYTDNTWRNNIFYQNDYAGIFTTFTFYQVRPKRVLVHNVICGDAPGRKLIALWDAKARTWKSHTLKEAEEKLSDMFADNSDIVPRFVDADRNDFRVARGSPCIDAGAFLASTTSRGSGKRITLDDARWFYDGFGLPGEQGDLIYVGARKRAARVLEVDRENGVLVVDRALRWEAHDPVSLPYNGRAPDLGAMEYGAEREKWYHRLTLPEGTYWTAPADGEPLVVSDFEDSSLERWGMLWNVDRKRNTEHTRSKDTAAGGSCSLRTCAAKNGATLAVDVEPWLWEIDRHPRVRFAYRIPPGVPVGIWLRCFSVKQFSGIWSQPRYSLGGSPAFLATVKDALGDHRLIDDDKWHTITIDARLIRKVHPELRYLRAFDFRNSPNKRGIAKEGDAFWIDDFWIGPEPRR